LPVNGAAIAAWVMVSLVVISGSFWIGASYTDYKSKKEFEISQVLVNELCRQALADGCIVSKRYARNELMSSALNPMPYYSDQSTFSKLAKGVWSDRVRIIAATEESNGDGYPSKIAWPGKKGIHNE